MMMTMRICLHALFPPCLLLISCQPDCEEHGDSGAWTPPAEVTLLEEQACTTPVEGFDRLVEESLSRGLDVELDTLGSMGLGNLNGGLSAADLDRDGDLDLIFGNLYGQPLVFENDGTGHFNPLPSPEVNLLDLVETIAAQHGAIDVDGDGWIDLLQVGYAAMWVYWNEEGQGFSSPEVIWKQSKGPFAQFGTMAWGDVDGDGDLDVVLPGLETRTGMFQAMEGEMPLGHPEVLLLQENGVLTEVAHLSPSDTPGVNITATFTDRDGDGDQDLFIPSDLGQIIGDYPPSAFYRNDGLDEEQVPLMIDDAPEIGADLRMSSMGISTGDWNNDGLFDYCISDTGPVKCLMSAPDGTYYEGGQALGLESPDPTVETLWSGWGMEVIDIDNDGLEDLAVAGGQPIGGGAAGRTYINAIWQGVDEGTKRFEHRPGHAFEEKVDHYGLVSADFDGDGYVEVVVSGAPGPISYWQNQCGSGSWVGIELRNRLPNWEAYGARIDLTAGDTTWSREIQNMHAMAQHTARQHFGLGELDRVDRIDIRWPDGVEVSYTDLPVNRHILIEHPDL